MGRSRQNISTLEATRYEVAITKNGQVVRSVGFTARKTKATLFFYAQENGREISDLLTESELDENYSYSALSGLRFGSVSVVYTGRTERDCAA